MESILVFLVEDDEAYARVIRMAITRDPIYEVKVFSSGQACIDHLHEQPAVVYLDFTLPDMSGFEVIKRLHRHDPELPIVIVSGQEDISTAIHLLKEGIHDYIVKDQDTLNRLTSGLKHLKEKIQLKKELDGLKEEIEKKYHFQQVIKGKSPVIQQVFTLIEKAAKTNITVMLTGESGTGKDLVAKTIHYNSNRKKRPFISLNISSFNPENLEDELFGHEKGGVSGSQTRKIGRLEQAGKGTLYLDDISELETNLQSKLLQALKDKEFLRLSGSEIVKLDARIIVSTKKDLGEEVQKGRFRQDLYYNLLGLPVELPPLRYRGDDILVLAKYFADEFCQENKSEKLSLTPAAQDKLMRYSYPGNIRELKAIIELACVMTNQQQIDDVDISFNSTVPHNDFLMEENTLVDYEKKIIRFYLQKYNNNVLLVADKLDIGKSTIYRMLKNKEL